jgi:hypothetical protein
MDASHTQNRTDANYFRRYPSLGFVLPRPVGIFTPAAQTSAAIGRCASFYPCLSHNRTIKSLARSMEPKKRRRPAAQGEPSSKFARPRSRWSSVITLPGRRTPSKVAVTPRAVLASPFRTGASCAGPERLGERSTPRDQSRPPTPRRAPPAALRFLRVLSIRAGLRRPPPGAQHPCLRLDGGGRDRSQSILRSLVVGFHPSLAELLPHPFQCRSEDVCVFFCVPDRPRPRPLI